MRQQYLARVFGMPQPSISRIESYWPAGDWPNLLSQKVVKSSGVAGIDEKYVLVPKRRPELVEGNEKPAGDMRRWMYVYLAVLELAGYDISQVHKASLCAGLSVAWPLEAAQNLVPNS